MAIEVWNESMPKVPTRTHGADISTPAGLIADRSRATMLLALAGGGEWSATDLAAVAGISAQTASSHLSKLADGRLVVATSADRARYYRLAGPDVADALRALTALAPTGTNPRRSRLEPPDAGARTCYDHLAGRLGVALTDALLTQRIISKEGGYHLTVRGAPALRALGLNLPAIRARRRSYALPCMDRTERRPHLGGSLGAALAARLLQLGWVQRIPGTRALHITPAGRRHLKATFGVEA
jgi:DNA-binding transcriptional ArsR family regulator